MLKIEPNFTAALKFKNWAENLPESTDFIDYWFNLFKSPVKEKIDLHPWSNINCFWWVRWQDILEEMYTPVKGESFCVADRGWFAMYMQYLIIALQLPPAEIAGFYGKDVFSQIIKSCNKYHTMSVYLFVEHVRMRHGLPPNVIVQKVNM